MQKTKNPAAFGLTGWDGETETETDTEAETETETERDREVGDRRF